MYSVGIHVPAGSGTARQSGQIEATMMLAMTV